MVESTLNQLVDLDLITGHDFILNNRNDLQTVTGKRAVVWGLIRRLMIVRGTWAYNENIGTGLRDLLRTRGTASVKEKEIEDIVREAAEPMMREGRISSIDYVRITKREKKTLGIEIAVYIGEEIEQVELEIPVT